MSKDEAGAKRGREGGASEGGEAGRELVHGRTFHAPRALVWKAWTEREHIEQWWGPNGFATTSSEMRFAPGGRWRFVMHGPDGVDYPNEIADAMNELPKVVFSRTLRSGVVILNYHLTGERRNPK